MAIPQKFIVISTGTLAGTLGLYELVKHFNLVRFCTGFKPLPVESTPLQHKCSPMSGTLQPWAFIRRAVALAFVGRGTLLA